VYHFVTQGAGLRWSPLRFDHHNDTGIGLMFHDNAASNEPVPDSGSALGLPLFVLAVLFGLRRLRSLTPA
jgi:hypothetical protein